MRGKVTTGIYLIAFVCLICLPQFVWNLLGEHMDTTENENRVAQEKPVFRWSEYDTYADAYEGYYSDALPFRSQLITCNSQIDYFIFRESPSGSSVIVGKDDWLFYSSPQDGDSIGCYKGYYLLDEARLQKVAYNMQQTDAYFKAHGIEFVLFIAPNKERMYPEMLPDYYGEPADTYLTLQIVQYLRENTDIRVVYAYDALMEAKNDNPQIDLYYKGDTHWNAAGGYVGGRALLDELGINLPELGDTDVCSVPDSEHCDLAKMISMHTYFKNIGMDYTVGGYTRQGQEKDPRKLFVSRDSFGGAIQEVLDSQFAESYMVYRQDYTPEMIEEQKPDIFVFELVERYVPILEVYKMVPYEE